MLSSSVRALWPSRVGGVSAFGTFRKFRGKLRKMSRVSIAPDVICINNKDNLNSTEFLIEFPSSSSLKNIFAAEHQASTVAIYSNDILCEDIQCLVINNRASFVENHEFTYFPSSSTLRKLKLTQPINTLRFHHLHHVVEVTIYKWQSSQRVVVVDIDGTITKSNVRGYVETVYLNIYNHTHAGAVKFLHALSELPTNSSAPLAFLYLTSRPFAHYASTKRFLSTLSDSTFLLPPGPVFANHQHKLKVLYRELVSKNVAEFKFSVLLYILETFLLAGCTSSPYFLGIGNKDTDVLAYRQVGIPINHILFVQPNSEIYIGTRDLTAEPEYIVYSGYQDDKLLSFTKQLYEADAAYPREIKIDKIVQNVTNSNGSSTDSGLSTALSSAVVDASSDTDANVHLNSMTNFHSKASPAADV